MGAVPCPRFPVPIAFKYAINAVISSSLIRPLYVGITGSKPAAIFACGSRIDSRT